MSNDKFNEVLQSMPKDGKRLYTEEQLAAQKDLSFNDGYKAGINFLESKYKGELERLLELANAYKRALLVTVEAVSHMGHKGLHSQLKGLLCDRWILNKAGEFDRTCEEIGDYLKALSQHKESYELQLKILNSNKDRLTREVNNLRLKTDEYENVITKFKEEKEKDKSKFWNKWLLWFR